MEFYCDSLSFCMGKMRMKAQPCCFLDKHRFTAAPSSYDSVWCCYKSLLGNDRLAINMETHLISYSEHLLSGGHICSYSQIGFLARNDVQ